MRPAAASMTTPASADRRTLAGANYPAPPATQARKMLIDEVVIALPLRAEERIGQLVAKFRPLPIDLRISIDPIADIFPLRTIGAIGGAKTIEVFNRPFKHVSGLLKMIEDKCLALLFFPVLLPLLGLIALAIRIHG